MRGSHILLALLVVFLLASVAAAQMCEDNDNGGSDDKDNALLHKGGVKYGITSKEDVCLTSENGVSTNESAYLREYFCNNQDQRDSEVYNCVKLGYAGCVDGACVGSGSGNTTVVTKPKTPVSSCGNEIVEKDKGETCDPPGSICFGKTSAQYGSCQSDCTCKIAASAQQNAPAVCGDEYLDAGEDCEKDTDCQTNYVCSSCKCVKQLTAEEIEAMKAAAKPAESEKTEEKTEVNEGDSTETVTMPAMNLTPKNYSDTPAMKATSGIANFFKSIFGWIGGLFS